MFQKVPKKFTEEISVKERVQCLRCNSFIYQKNYETHTKKCLPKKCSKCDKVLKNRGALRTHMKTHTAGRLRTICILKSYLQFFCVCIGNKDKRMLILYSVPISLWPTLGKENRYLYTRHPNNNYRWRGFVIIFLELRL